MHKLSKALTFMCALLALTFCAVSCKTDDDDEPTMYTVIVSSSLEHGKVTADKSSAEAGAKVKLTPTADSGYELDSYSVKDEKSNTITVTEGTFTMPKSNVTVSATFKEIAVTPQKTAGSISYATTSVEKTTAAEAFTNALTKTGDGTVSYASSKTDVAEVNATTGLVTIKGAGEATITATVTDSDTYTYATKTASYTLTVIQASPLNLNLKTGGDINSILGALCADDWGRPACTKFARSDTNNDEATLYLDTEEKYIPVWSEGTEVYYYVPDGCTPVMNEDSSKMFGYCTELTSLDVDGFDTSNVTNMSDMFYYCYGLTSLDVSKFDTSKVTDMSGMFDGCSGLTSLDVTSFDTSNVTDMSDMFSNCSGLTSLDVSKFDTGNVTNMSYMFTGCSGLTSLDVTCFDTSKVTDMSGMFVRCSGLKSLDVTGFDTSNVTDMGSMFTYCSGLTSLDVTGFDTSKVTSMSGMFSNCSGLTILDLSNFDTSKVSNMWGMFSYNEELTKIYASDKFVTTSIPDNDINTKYMCFFFCKKLVGGAGTTFDASNNDQALAVPYARIDGGTDAPGYFTLKPIGSKSKPDAVGDIVFNDGSATPYTADLTLTEEQKSKAVAVIFYAGSASDTLGAKTLGVGLKNTGIFSTLAWAKSGVNGCSTNITAIQCKPSSEEAATATFEGDTDGSDNWQALCAAVSDEGTSGNYPAWEWVNAYATTASLTGDYASGWYLPTVAELSMLYRAKDTVNSALTKAGGTKISAPNYWSSSQNASDGSNAWLVLFGAGNLNCYYKLNVNSVCAVRAF